MNNSRFNVYKLSSAAIVAAVYAVLTLVLAPISYGEIQCRVSEALCILPFFVPFTSWGLYAGCLIANLFTGNIFDILFGSLATLFAALCTAYIGKKGRDMKHCILGCFMPVIFNAVIIGAVIVGAYIGVSIFENPGLFALTALSVSAGEAVALYVIGLPLMRWLPGKQFFRDFVEKANR